MTEHEFLAALRAFWLEHDVASLGVDSVHDDPEAMGAEGTSWVRWSMRTEGGVRRGAGRAREETRGLVDIEVHTPRPDGPGKGERLSSAIAAVWRTFRHPRIQLTAPSVVGLPADGAFIRHRITLGWRGDMRLAQ